MEPTNEKLKSSQTEATGTAAEAAPQAYNPEHSNGGTAAPSPSPRKHSGIGVASFILSLVSFVGLVGAFISITVLTANFASNPDMGLPGETMPMDLIGTFAFLGGIVVLAIILALVGCVLGLVGLFQKDKLKLFSILGMIFNTLIVGFFLIIIVISALIGASLPGVI